MNQKISRLLTDIYSPTSVYATIFDKCVPNEHRQYIDDLKAELALQITDNEAKFLALIDRKEEKYYLTVVIKHSTNSATSPFYRKYILDSRCRSTELTQDWTQDDTDLERKVEIEEQLEQIESAIYSTRVTWYEKEVFMEYYVNNKSLREIAKEFDCSHNAINSVVNRVRTKIKKEIYGNN